MIQAPQGRDGISVLQIRWPIQMPQRITFDERSIYLASLWKTGPTDAHLRSNCFEIQYIGITS